MTKVSARALLTVLSLFALFCAAGLAQTPSGKQQPARKSSSTKSGAKAAKKPAAKKTPARRPGTRERFYTNSYADDVTAGDSTAGEDQMVRAAAVDALGNMNGAAVVIDPFSGRVLAMVNQKLALSSGAPPCSTIKLAVALAALCEGLVTKDTPVQLGPQWRMNMVSAMAISNNTYFEALGREMGFEKVSYYARLFGIGEIAGDHIAGEQRGMFPSQELDQRLGGVGKMCSFGESVYMTPLQLGALVSAIANGGTLYYLQHPRTPEEATNFQPKVKRQLEIGPWAEEVAAGMAAAVRYGTARSLRYIFREEPVLGKTGTCSKNGTRYGWFACYNRSDHRRTVTVVFLQGGQMSYGPKAVEIAARLYRNLYHQRFFAAVGPASPDSARADSHDHR
jgi:cell division protein FtsI/penicillin-binding protein 2